MLIIQFLVPILQIALFCLCVGRQLTDIPVGVVSREKVRSGSMAQFIFEKVDKKVINLVEENNHPYFRLSNVSTPRSNIHRSWKLNGVSILATWLVSWT